MVRKSRCTVLININPGIFEDAGDFSPPISLKSLWKFPQDSIKSLILNVLQ